MLKILKTHSAPPPMDSLEALFCQIDDFCQSFEPRWRSTLLEPGVKRRQRQRAMSLSEIMTILVRFHYQSYRTFKHFYQKHVCQYWREAFPGLPSYQRFVDWIPSSLMPLCVYLKLGITFFAKPKRHMKNQLIALTDQLLTRKRSIVETIIGQFKNILKLSILGIEVPPNFW